VTIVIDREALAVMLSRPERTIREHCTVIGYDHRGRALYDGKACALVLQQVPTRTKRAA
jgi:hypothetical protein